MRSAVHRRDAACLGPSMRFHVGRVIIRGSEAARTSTSPLCSRTNLGARIICFSAVSQCLLLARKRHGRASFCERNVSAAQTRVIQFQPKSRRHLEPPENPGRFTAVRSSLDAGSPSRTFPPPLRRPAAAPQRSSLITTSDAHTWPATSGREVPVLPCRRLGGRVFVSSDRRLNLNGLVEAKGSDVSCPTIARLHSRKRDLSPSTEWEAASRT